MTALLVGVTAAGPQRGPKRICQTHRGRGVAGAITRRARCGVAEKISDTRQPPAREESAGRRWDRDAAEGRVVRRGQWGGRESSASKMCRSTFCVRSMWTCLVSV